MEAKDKLEQDEAIYQAGKKAGIREVVDYFQQLAKVFKVSTFKDVMSSPLVQAKLKNWHTL